MSLPIIFIHRGDDEYLSYSLQQAKRSNPDSPVILIGKDANKKYAVDGILHAEIDDYMQTAHAFKPVYKHSHVMPFEYSLFCFQRWFILRDYMRRNQIERCCYLDSDVMLYTDVNNTEFQDFRMEFVWTNFVSQSILDGFCSFTTAYFSQPVLFTRMIQFTRQIGHVSGSLPLVSDMVLGLLFLRQFPQHTYTHGMYGDAFFDENINRPIWAESHYGKRKVYLRDGGLYSKEAGANKFFRLHSLHFQGLDTKELMPYFFTPLLSTTGCFFFDYATRQWMETT